MEETFTIHGEFGQFPVSYGVKLDENGNFDLPGATAFLESLGVKPPASIAPTPAPSNGGGSFRERISGNSGGGGGGWSCPVHGSEKVSAARSGGMECKAYSSRREDWSQEQPWTGRDGSVTRYYCKHRSR